MSAADDDSVIHDFLDRRHPSQFDAFMQEVGRRLVLMKPLLDRKVRTNGSNFDAEETVARGIAEAFEHLYWQYLHDKDVAFRFTREHTFEAWVMFVIGRPGARARSGIV